MPDIRINRLPLSVNERLQAAIDTHLGVTFPALALAVWDGGEAVLEGAWGVVDPEGENQPVTSDHRFDLASVSKLFTTTAFLSLVSAGVVQLDDPVLSVIPEFGGVRGIDGGQDPHTRVMLPPPDESAGQVVDAMGVTFAHLLTHTSGLAPWRALFEHSPMPPPPHVPDPINIETRRANALESICASLFVGQPGSAIRYSDLGLILLGEAVARLHGASLDVVVRERVTQPLGLASVTYNPVRNGLDRALTIPTEFDRLWRKRRCWGEVHDENACGMGGVAGHAGLFGTAADIAAFGQYWLTGDPRLKIAPEVRAHAISLQAADTDSRRGIGWMLKSEQNSSAGDRFSMASFGHTGFTGTSLWIDPERRLVVACLTNRVYYGRERTGIHEFRRAIHDILYDAP